MRGTPSAKVGRWWPAGALPTNDRHWPAGAKPPSRSQTQTSTPPPAQPAPPPAPPPSTSTKWKQPAWTLERMFVAEEIVSDFPVSVSMSDFADKVQDEQMLEDAKFFIRHSYFRQHFVLDNLNNISRRQPEVPIPRAPDQPVQPHPGLHVPTLAQEHDRFHVPVRRELHECQSAGVLPTMAMKTAPNQ